MQDHNTREEHSCHKLLVIMKLSFKVNNFRHPTCKLVTAFSEGVDNETLNTSNTQLKKRFNLLCLSYITIFIFTPMLCESTIFHKIFQNIPILNVKNIMDYSIEYCQSHINTVIVEEGAHRPFPKCRHLRWPCHLKVPNNVMLMFEGFALLFDELRTKNFI